jgi:hypothetical protein
MCWGLSGCDVGKKGRPSFLKKRSKKLLTDAVADFAGGTNT